MTAEPIATEPPRFLEPASTEKRFLMYNLSANVMHAVSEDRMRELEGHPDWEPASLHQPPPGMPVRSVTTIAVVMAVWGRAALTEAVMRYYRDTVYPTMIRAGRQVVFIAADSPDDPDPMPPHVRAMFDAVISAPNVPLGAKWNAAVEYVRESVEPGAMLLILGSDDLVNPEYIEVCAEYVERGAVRVDTCTCWMYDAVGLRASILHGARIGAGRALSWDALVKVGFRPWPAEATHNLEGLRDATALRVDPGQDALLRDAGIRRVMIAPETKPLAYIPMIVDVKTGQNCWSWEVFDPQLNPMCSYAAPGSVMAAFPGFRYFEMPVQQAA